MKFQVPIASGTIIKRYKRFLSDIKLDSGELITAHVANTGSMKTCWEENWPALVTYHDQPSRKLKYSLEMLHNGQTWIGINTSKANDIVHEALKDKMIPSLSHYNCIKREQKIGESRIDFYLSISDDTLGCYIEVKNVTLLGEEKIAYFPDSISLRGQKHLQELIHIKKSGSRAIIFYLVQREDIRLFKPAAHIDPVYAKLLKEAEREGVEIMVYECCVSPAEIKVKSELPYEI